MPQKHKSKRGRGGRGGHHHAHQDPDFGDDFTIYETVAARGHRGRGYGRGAFNHMSSVFVPAAAATRAAPRGGPRGSGPSTPARGRGSPVPRGRGDFQPRGRGGAAFRGNTRGNFTPRGRGRGYGYADRGYGSGTESQTRLLEPVKFVAAASTPRFLFEEGHEDDIFKAEVVDLAQDGAPTADFVEAAFATQLGDQRGSEGDTAEGESDFRPQANDRSERIANNPQRQSSSSNAPSKELPKLDIASAVSLATRLKDAALTPREETFRSTTPRLEPPINRNGAATPILIAPIAETQSDSESEAEDVVLFVPTPQTPARSFTPLPLFNAPAPGPAHMLSVSPSPMRPSPLSSSFSPPVQEEEDAKLETIVEIPGPEPLATESGITVPDIVLSEVMAEVGFTEHVPTEPTPALTEPAPETEVPVINFEDLSSVMFIDTTPAPVKEVPTQDSTPSHGLNHEHVLGVQPARERASSSPRPHSMEFEFSSQSATNRDTTGTSPQAKKVTITEAQTAVETTLPAPEAPLPRPATPNFHTMTFKFTPRSPASRARKVPNYQAHRGLGFKFSGKARVPREGDSDLDWGDNGPPKSKGKLKSTGNQDDESDDDPGMIEDVSGADMLNFLKNLDGEWTTMDDIKDKEMLRQEDEDDELHDVDSEGDSEDEDEDEDEDADDLDMALAAAEGEFVESDDDIIVELIGEDDSDDSDDIEGSFRTRLNRLRESTPGRGKKGKKAKKAKKKKGKGKGKGRVDDDSSSSDDFRLATSGFSKADLDEDFIAGLEDQFAEDMQLKRERKRGIISPPLSPASRKKNIPAELQAQWERDRQKKAENKRLRALQRQVTALENSPKRGAGSKAKFLFNSGPLLTLSDVETRLRSFVNNLAQNNMAFPAMDKESRRRIHLMAECFKISTTSKGKGVGRYVTLKRTSRTGIGIDEKKIRRLVNAANEAEGGGAVAFNKAYYRRVDDGPAKSKIKTQDGEIIGHKAAKIGEDNVGHKLLSKMGWSEGDRIGMSGGLSDPLQAVMKRSKLGLGAT
ncbi:unnamed protein product [Rhizoctonia solani]|uniref:Protein SQS1 n=1 Tax=Rhizoctonia solani TaxID=456999 RepID=A0A8H3B5Y7_9AGAM|nr:unnamed protein product [Rhizoctonia solani]